MNLLLLLLLAAFAAEVPQAQPRRHKLGLIDHSRAEKIPEPDARANLRMSVWMRNQELARFASFQVRSQSQSNYVVGGELPFERETKKGRSVEFVKHGFIVNCLPVLWDTGDKVSAECQFELSGPLKPVGQLGARPVETMQLQASFVAPVGKKLVLVDEPDRKLEVQVEVVQ